MRIRPVIAAPLLLWAAAAAAQVTVSFVNPGRYTDAGGNVIERKETTDAIERYLKELGDRYLAGQTLKIEVLDIDLAGRLRYGGSEPRGLRVVDGRTDAPAIELRYTLESGGKPGETRRETVFDLDYFTSSIAPSSNESLYYEKRMLDEWFRKRFSKDATKP